MFPGKYGKRNMKEFEVIVAGAGAGGICAAVAAARTGARVALVERNAEIGGTGVFSPVALVCRFHGADHRPVNMGIHRELFFEIYRWSTKDNRLTSPRLTYDEKVLKERYDALVAAEDNLTLLTGSGITAVDTENGKLTAIELENGDRLGARVFVDGTADGNLSAMAGCGFEKGRARDGAMQSATLTFALGNIDTSKLRIPEFSSRGGCDSLWEELDALYLKAKEEGRTANPKNNIVAFPYPDGKRLLFNCNEVLGVDPTSEESLAEGMERGRQYVEDLVAIFRGHPAFSNARIEFISPILGIREGRRIHGDYTLTEEDCFGEARFDDMVSACAYDIDIHDPEGGPTRLEPIPGSGYYHIPYRCLIAKDMTNLLLGSRCISGTHEAHSSYRVISSVTAIGQAAGTAAALAARHTGGSVREVPSPWIRHTLREQLQFVEGTVEPPPPLTKEPRDQGTNLDCQACR